MLKHKVTWIVTADARQARILTRRENGSGFEVIAAFQAQPSPGSRGDREAGKIEFLRIVADYLNKNSAEKSVRSLVLFAAEDALGHLRTLLAPEVAQKIRAEGTAFTSPPARSETIASKDEAASDAKPFRTPAANALSKVPFALRIVIWVAAARMLCTLGTARRRTLTATISVAAAAAEISV